MTLRYVHRHVLPVALALLPERMKGARAEAMLLAIALQESNHLRARRQYNNGPAMGFWQFERMGGVKGVLTHRATAPHAIPICQQLVVPATPIGVWTAIQYHDVLAAVFARLLLWTLPGELAQISQPEKGWEQYIAAWRPGKPHPGKWQNNFETAWDVVIGDA
jgi:hypothetical protein